MLGTLSSWLAGIYQTALGSLCAPAHKSVMNRALADVLDAEDAVAAIPAGETADMQQYGGCSWGGQGTLHAVW